MELITLHTNTGFTQSLHTAMTKLAKKKNISLGQAIRNACENYVSENTPPPAPPVAQEDPVENIKFTRYSQFDTPVPKERTGITYLFERIKKWRPL